MANQDIETHYVTHYVSDLITGLTDPMGSQVQGEASTPRSITKWSWAILLHTYTAAHFIRSSHHLGDDHAYGYHREILS